MGSLFLRKKDEVYFAAADFRRLHKGESDSLNAIFDHASKTPGYAAIICKLNSPAPLQPSLTV